MKYQENDNIKNKIHLNEKYFSLVQNSRKNIKSNNIKVNPTITFSFLFVVILLFITILLFKIRNKTFKHKII